MRRVPSAQGIGIALTAVFCLLAGYRGSAGDGVGAATSRRSPDIELIPRLGHRNDVSALAVSRDGLWALSGDWNAPPSPLPHG